jgi:hypothetical protein
MVFITVEGGNGEIKRRRGGLALKTEYGAPWVQYQCWVQLICSGHWGEGWVVFMIVGDRSGKIEQQGGLALKTEYGASWARYRCWVQLICSGH